MDSSKFAKVENYLKILGIFFTAGALFFTYLTYDASQRWKVAEFTSAKYKEFSENKSVVLVNEMLDYNTRGIALFSNDSLLPISDDVIFSALVIDTLNGEFTKTEVEIRDIFDNYFDQVSLFNRYAKANLIGYEEIKPYIFYQTSIIADTTNIRKSNRLRYRIWDYINYYGFNDVKELYQNLGYDINRK